MEKEGKSELKLNLETPMKSRRVINSLAKRLYQNNKE
jgi:hypothetical protein